MDSEDIYSVYKNAITIMNFSWQNDVLSFISYIPDLYKNEDESTNEKNVMAFHKKAIYRFYGIENNHTLLGYAKYYIPIDDETLELDSIQVSTQYRSKGLGTILLNQSIEDILIDFQYLKKIIVCSLSDSSTRFYKNNGFEIYLGDNCLKMSLERK